MTLYDSRLTDQPITHLQLSSDQIRRMPKAVLHFHLDGGCPRPLYDQIIHILTRQGRLPSTALIDPKWDGKGGLPGFLDAYSRIQDVLVNVHRPHLFEAIMQHARQQGVVYTEILASLQTLRPNWKQLAASDQYHAKKHQADDPMKLAKAVTPTLAELADSARRHNTSVGVLCALNPHNDTTHMLTTIQAAKHLRNQGLPVVGIGIAGKYAPFQPINQVLQKEDLDGLLYVPHAGELPTEPNLQDALEGCPPLPSRIAHGIEAQISQKLISKLIKYDICCDMCITSNEQLGACSPGRHPIIDLMRAGVPCTINPDDPLLFSVDVCQEYERVQQLGAQPQELVQLARNSINYSGADVRLRRRWLADLNAWASKNVQSASSPDL